MESLKKTQNKLRGGCLCGDGRLPRTIQYRFLTKGGRTRGGRGGGG